MSKSKGIPQERIKVQFLRPKGNINQRELLKLVLPRHEVVPFVEPTLGQERQKCRLGLDACPLRPMIGGLQVKLQDVCRSLASQLELCSICKIKQSSLERAILELTTSQTRITGFLEEG